MNGQLTNAAGTRMLHKVERVAIKVTPLGALDPLEWLAQNPFQGDAFILAHAYDGVNWGRFAAGQVYYSHDAAPHIAPALDANTLQQLRVFNEAWEIFFWHDGAGWLHRLIVDGDENEEGGPCDVIDESHVLWGSQAEQYVGGFSILADGSQGLRHALPIDASAVSLSSRAALHVRHYLAEYDNGVRYIAHSRLVNMEVKYYGA